MSADWTIPQIYLDQTEEIAELEARVAELEVPPPLLPGNTPYVVGWNDCVRWLGQAHAALSGKEAGDD